MKQKSSDSEDLQIIHADLADAEHQEAIKDILDEYANHLDGKGLDADVMERLIPGLQACTNGLILLAVQVGEAVGLAICFRGFATFQARPIINIHDLAVRSGWRGKGIGSRLLKAVEEEALKSSCSKITLEVLDRNPGARKLYERMGYKGSDPGSAEGITYFLSKELL